MSSLRFLASVRADGRPTYSVRSRIYSALNDSSAQALSNSFSSCSKAGIRVSGTYRPPNAPKRPRESGREIMVICY